MYKKIISLGLFIVLFACAFSIPAITHAQTSAPIIDPSAAAYTSGDYTLTDIMRIAIGASRWILGIVGSLALIMFIYGGFTFLISAGSSDKVGQARKIIVAAVIGLIIVFTSYIIIKFVLNSLGLDWKGNDKKMGIIATP